MPPATAVERRAFDTSDGVPRLKKEIEQVAAGGGGLLEVAMGSIPTLVDIITSIGSDQSLERISRIMLEPQRVVI